MSLLALQELSKHVYASKNQKYIPMMTWLQFLLPYTETNTYKCEQLWYHRVKSETSAVSKGHSWLEWFQGSKVLD